ncbi:ribonucleotide reductase (plasmid) [Haloterrigena turkmenica DSM 5511]|uniref:Ribonucleotide reductase n=2 Tax=Haloterrigena turkmenica TaxID=62320 RepID=D2S0R0_HALTV|nr:ribonucleotide reductase [Haloterrigena turkmenica DSM 5511]
MTVLECRDMSEESPVSPLESSGLNEHPKRLVRSAIEYHWDPAAIDVRADQEAVSELSRVEFTRLRGLLAQFGAGERAVTTDLAPLAVVLDGSDEQRYIATQLYDEARHTELFDRYWKRVIRPEEESRGLIPTEPMADRWSHDDYRELFDRTSNAMARLLERDTSETRARAFCHYHLTVEGILAQTAYRWVETRYSGELEAVPELPGLVNGFRYLRRDEGRHVSFGVTKVRKLVDKGVDPETIVETIDELVPLVETTIDQMVRDGSIGADRNGILNRIDTARDRRLEQVGVVPSKRT